MTNQMTAQEINAMMALQSAIRETIHDYGVMDVLVDQGKGISINFSKMEQAELQEYKVRFNQVLADHKSPFKDRQIAIASLTQIEGLLEIFDTVDANGLDSSGMTGAEVVFTVIGKPIRVIKKTSLGAYFYTDTDSVRDGVAKVKDSSISATNKFANWLAGKTQ